MTTMYKPVVDTPQSRVKRGIKRVPSDAKKERKKEDGIRYFHKLPRPVFLKEFGSSPSTSNKQ